MTCFFPSSRLTLLLVQLVIDDGLSPCLSPYHPRACFIKRLLYDETQSLTAFRKLTPCSIATPYGMTLTLTSFSKLHRSSSRPLLSPTPPPHDVRTLETRRAIPHPTNPPYFTDGGEEVDGAGGEEGEGRGREEEERRGREEVEGNGREEVETVDDQVGSGAD
jgi:hypothetical protein